MDRASAATFVTTSVDRIYSVYATKSAVHLVPATTDVRTVWMELVVLVLSGAAASQLWTPRSLTVSCYT